jgi:hypothetical protein
MLPSGHPNRRPQRASISWLTQGFSICCLRFMSGVAASHAGLASGWRATPLPRGGRTLWIASKGFRLHNRSPFPGLFLTQGCSQPTKHAPKWAAPIPTRPKSHNHCEAVLRRTLNCMVPMVARKRTNGRCRVQVCAMTNTAASIRACIARQCHDLECSHRPPIISGSGSARLGAALAYSVFSMGPLMLIMTSVAGLFFGTPGIAFRP